MKPITKVLGKIGRVVWAAASQEDASSSRLGSTAPCSTSQVARRRLEHLAGRLAARRALLALGFDPSRTQIIRDLDGGPKLRGEAEALAISITHSAGLAYAAVGCVRSLGIDLCCLEAGQRLRLVADRFLRRERHLLGSPYEHAACWALKEAGLKALRLGLLEGGIFDERHRIEVLSLDPPRIRPPWLRVRIIRTHLGPLAIAWQLKHSA